MTFWKRTLPLLIAFVLGLTFTAQYYIPHPVSEALLTEASVWNQIIAGFAIILGVGSLLRVHYLRIARQEAGWGYSGVLFVSMLIVLGAGLWSGGVSEGSLFGWLYSYVIVALQSTMFSLLAFFVASAAYRAFRARQPRGERPAAGRHHRHGRPGPARRISAGRPGPALGLDHAGAQHRSPTGHPDRRQPGRHCDLDQDYFRH